MLSIRFFQLHFVRKFRSPEFDPQQNKIKSNKLVNSQYFLIVFIWFDSCEQNLIRYHSIFIAVLKNLYDSFLITGPQRNIWNSQRSLRESSNHNFNLREGSVANELKRDNFHFAGSSQLALWLSPNLFWQVAMEWKMWNIAKTMFTYK